MLPANPRAGRSVSATRRPAAAAQPRSTSRPRTDFSVTERDDWGKRGRTQQPASTRQVRPQYSTGKLPARMDRPIQTPPLMSRTAQKSTSSTYSPSAFPRAPPSRGSESSSSSLSSSGSSFLDRMKQRNLGSSSSQSSLELEEESLGKDRIGQRWGATEPSRRGLVQDNDGPSSESTQERAYTDYTSYGYSLWSRITDTAGSWGWAGSVQGGDTSTNKHESELTRILKAYYINKARDRSDLPDWLFEESERGIVKASRPEYDRGRLSDFSEGTERTRTGRFYANDNAAASDLDYRASGRTVADARVIVDSEAQGSSKATNRLKDLRDAKRQVATARRTVDSTRTRFMEEDRGRADRADAYDRRYDTSSGPLLPGRRGDDIQAVREPARRMPPARVGLPANPRRR
ncbi:hypothetical protein M0805_009310 [Coniferiporia weirii]|nr:hypothetical protein M0805_009310 [Coniferiporia weirii]